jgi:hypothetical protein
MYSGKQSQRYPTPKFALHFVVYSFDRDRTADRAHAMLPKDGSPPIALPIHPNDVADLDSTADLCHPDVPSGILFPEQLILPKEPRSSVLEDIVRSNLGELCTKHGPRLLDGIVDWSLKTLVSKRNYVLVDVDSCLLDENVDVTEELMKFSTLRFAFRFVDVRS